ncbi:MAG TPA: hypothetical protein VFP91_06255 [Vicinamibacterales bacterium]|nr:hypothetical protein [Vicinamibacterales bacterium]
MKPHHLLFLGVVTLSALAGAAVRASDDSNLIVHEWGTFTSVAGADGHAVDWLPLRAPDDLPCFVEHLGLDFKGTLAAKVRMETPVLYFYAPRAMQVDVAVRFNRGVVTEWFPHATVTPSTVNAVAAAGYRRRGMSSTAVWNGVTVTPQATPSFADDGRPSHYYVARKTDAAPVTVGSVTEKFLFYRGVGGFEPPVSASLDANDGVDVRSVDAAPLDDAMLFENRAGHVAYRSIHRSSSVAHLDPLQFDGESATPQAELERVLVAHGLYPAEAKAMVDTWRDSWFEEGTRLFYMVPRRAIDDILPIDMHPTPSALVRVFVGRIELVTAATRHEVASALASNDSRTLAKYARFLPAIVATLPEPQPKAVLPSAPAGACR